MTSQYLLDTHIFLWAVTENRRLSPQVAAIITDPDNENYVSAASVWEISIKAGLGKLTGLHRDAEDLIDQIGLHRLDIKIKHAQLAGSLPLLHRDPFDRMLVAQAQIEDLTLITDDRSIEQYDVTTLRP